MITNYYKTESMKKIKNPETSRVVKVAAVQISPILYSCEATVEKGENGGKLISDFQIVRNTIANV